MGTWDVVLLPYKLSFDVVLAALLLALNIFRASSSKLTQLAFAYSKSTMETPKQCAESVQSLQ